MILSVNYLLVFIASLLVGIVTFPVLFYFQKIFGLPIPDLNKSKFHIHHSFYGLLLIVIGVFLYSSTGIIMIGLGIGFIIHHEYSEPGLKGVSKFIYFRQDGKNKMQ